MERIDILGPDDIRRREEMKEALITIFDGNSILYDLYKNRNWLDKLFTPNILDMEQGALYSVAQAADIIEVPHYNIRNKRKDFVDYLQPTIMGEKHLYDYIGVFKLKMIDGLTGQGGDFNLSDIKSLLHDGMVPKKRPQEQALSGDLMRDLFSRLEARMRQFEADIDIRINSKIEAATEKLIENQQLALPQAEIKEELTKEIAEVIEQKLSSQFHEQISLLQEEINQTNAALQIDELREDMQNKDTETKNLINTLNETQQIIEDERTSIQIKEKAFAAILEAKLNHPTLAYLINGYERHCGELIKLEKKKIREEELMKIKSQALELFRKANEENVTEEDREKCINELKTLSERDPSIENEISMYIISTLSLKRSGREKRKKFLGIF